MKYSVAASPDSIVAQALLPHLPLDPIWKGVDQAVLTADAVTSVEHPPLVRGVVRWGELVAALTRSLKPYQWERSPEANHGHFLHSTLPIGFIVITGCSATGRIDRGHPRFRSRLRSKRPLVEANFRLCQCSPALTPEQRDLFETPIQARPEARDRWTFFLMVHHPSDGELLLGTSASAVELNLPVRLHRRTSMWVDVSYIERMPLKREFELPRIITGDDADVVNFDFEIEEIENTGWAEETDETSPGEPAGEPDSLD